MHEVYEEFDSDDEPVWNPRVVAFVRYYWPEKNVEAVLAHEGWSLGYTLWIREMKKHFFETYYPECTKTEDQDFRGIKDGHNAFTVYLDYVAKKREPTASLYPTLEDGIRWKWSPKP